VVEAVWAIVRQENRFLLAQKSVVSNISGAWMFPCGEVDPTKSTHIDAASRVLEEEVGLKGEQFKKLCILHMDQYRISVFLCGNWSGGLKPTHRDIIGIGWFAISEMHSLNQSLSPFVNSSLSYLSYLVQHYDHNPDQWKE